MKKPNERVDHFAGRFTAIRAVGAVVVFWRQVGPIGDAVSIAGEVADALSSEVAA